MDPFSPNSGPAQQPNQTLMPNTAAQPPVDPMASMQGYHKWMLSQLIQPQTRLDISGRPVDPTAPSDFDALRASTALAGHSWDHPPTPSATGSQMVGGQEVPLSPTDPMWTKSAMPMTGHQPITDLGGGQDITPFGNVGLQQTGSGETPPPATFGPNKMSASQFFTGEGIDGANPNFMKSVQGLPEKSLANMRNEHGITLPANTQDASNYNETHFSRSDQEQQNELQHMLASVNAARSQPAVTPSSALGAPAPREQMGPPSEMAGSFPPFKVAVGQGVPPMPQTGVLPWAAQAGVHGANNVTQWLMEKLFGTNKNNVTQPFNSPQQMTPEELALRGVSM